MEKKVQEPRLQDTGQTDYAYALGVNDRENGRELNDPFPFGSAESTEYHEGYEGVE